LGFLNENVFLFQDFHNAVQLFHKQLRLPGRPPSPALYSALGRVYLQIGDVQLAQHAFNSAADLRDVSKTIDAVASLTDAGLVAIAQNAFAEALGYFQQALTLQPDNPVVKFPDSNKDNSFKKKCCIVYCLFVVLLLLFYY
jgi:Flp pilus assembly protein TadD